VTEKKDTRESKFMEKYGPDKTKWPDDVLNEYDDD
jgi:hypothetical protein